MKTGLMHCPECEFKHAIKLEHHLEDSAVYTGGHDKLLFTKLRDQTRSIRKTLFAYIVKNKIPISDSIGCSVCSKKAHQSHGGGRMARKCRGRKRRCKYGRRKNSCRCRKRPR